MRMMARIRTRDAEAELNLPPGFRFHPTDEELVVHYLCSKAQCRNIPVPIIAEIDLYKYNPWQLPEKALFGSKDWYFFTPRDRKYPNGSRPNRAAGSGYWKATGADKPIKPAGSSKPLGIKKALVFYNGKAPKGVKTDWIMQEYRLADTDRSAKKNSSSLRLDDWVLCRLYNKKNNWEKISTKVEEESFSMSDNTASDSLRTPESDLEHNGTFHTVFQPVSSSMNNCSNGDVKEDFDDWFTDLNLEELQSCLGMTGLPTPGADFSSQDYSSHYLKLNQNDFSTFFSS